MKTRIIHIFWLLPLAAILSFSACTKNFEELNDNPIGVSQEDLKADYQHIGAFFPQIQQMIYCNFNWGWGTNWPFQIMQNLNADIFSGYMMTPTPFASNINNTTYALVDGWNGSAWDYTYSYMMPGVLEVEKLTADEFQHFGAVAKILKVLAISRLSDLYGPVIYTHYGESRTGGTFDSQQEAYYAFEADLANAAQVLTEFVAANGDATPFADFDQFFGGDYKQWIKFANSLRLRLAMRMALVDPTKAKTEAEAAVAQTYGVFTNGDLAAVSGQGYTHPLAAISGGWNDIEMNAVIETIMKGYSDPRMGKYFQSATDQRAKDAGYTYKGIRQGIALTDKANYVGHSLLNIASETPAVLMTAAEVFFLRAEGALRGWNMGGTAQDFYEAGVNESFSQWGVSSAAYLSSDAVQANYVDVVTPGNSIAALNNVSPRWDDAADFDTKLAKIAIQKWLAIFPEGGEAWAEQRRLNYPKLFPVMENYSQGVISTTEGVKRLNFSVTEKSNNPTGYSEAVQMLGGADTGATPLWWDVN